MNTYIYTSYDVVYTYKNTFWCKRIHIGVRMSIKNVVIAQHREVVNRAIKGMREAPFLKEGWIKTVRKALNMTVPQLAKRLRVTRASIYKTEKSEQSGGITLKKMNEAAEAMGCRFVFAIVPHYAGATIEEFIEYKARKMAIGIIKKTNTNMALEAQDLSMDKIEEECNRLAQEILQTRPSDIWND